MTEAYLKSRLCKVLRAELKGAVVFRHEDQFTGGIPDISVTWEKRTVWIEVKLDRPGRKSKVSELQQLAIRQMGAMLLTYGFGKNGKKWTTILENGLMGTADGFNHQWVKNCVITAIAAQFTQQPKGE